MSNEQIKKITSSHWGAFEAIIENGKLISTKPFEEDLNPNDIYLNLSQMLFIMRQESNYLILEKDG